MRNFSDDEKDEDDLWAPAPPISTLDRWIYRFANADPRDIVAHSDRARWRRTATALALYFVYATVATYTFAHGLESVPQVACALAALLVATAIVSFDRGVLGTTSANLDDLKRGPGSDAPSGLDVLRGNADPVARLSLSMIFGRVFIGLLMAFVVTHQLSTAVFHHQIERQRAGDNRRAHRALVASPSGPIRQARAEIRRRRDQLAPLRGQIKALERDVLTYDRKAIRSSHGHDVTGKVGCGTNCQGWLKQRNEAQASLARLQQRLSSEDRKAADFARVQTRRAAAAQAKADRVIARDVGGLSDTLALYRYLVANPSGLVLFVPLSLLLLGLEMAAILYKVAGHNSLYEFRAALRVRLGVQQAIMGASAAKNAGVAAFHDGLMMGSAMDAFKKAIAEAGNDPKVISRSHELAVEGLLRHLGVVAPASNAQESVRAPVDPDPPRAYPEPDGPLRFPQRTGPHGAVESVVLEPGAVVVGQFSWRLEGRLPVERQGGQSVVFFAREVGGTERRAVIKFMHIPVGGAPGVDDLTRRRALRELRNADQLPDNQFIVPVLDKVVDAGEGALWLATPLAEHGSLVTFYGGRDRRSLREVILVAGQIAAALNAAYSERRIVHRDVKPGNVLVYGVRDRDHPRPGFLEVRVRVTDWALARIESLMEGALDVTPGGTLWFAPPQSADLNTADPRDDLFGLGCVLWWLVTGEPPLFYELGPNADAHQIAERVAERQLAPRPCDDLRYWQPEVPVELATFVRQLLSYDRGRRAPAVVNPLEWAETTLKRMHDRFDMEAGYSGVDIEVGPALEPAGIRELIDHGHDPAERDAGPPTDDEEFDEMHDAFATLDDAQDPPAEGAQA